MPTRIQVRRDTTVNWTTANPVLGNGEPSLDITVNKMKYGDGVTAWSALPYQSPGFSDAVASAAALYGRDVRSWASFTSYVAGQYVVSPAGELVRAKTSFVSGASYSAANWTIATTMQAAGYGVIGDGATDDAAALNALLSSAAAFGAEVTLDAGSTVLISSVTVTIPTGTRLNLNGATIKSALPGLSDRLLTISGVSNVHIHSGTLDGNTAGWAGATTEQRHNVLIKNSSNVTIRKVLSKNAHGDGVYVGDQAGYSSDVYLERVICDGNWRNGMSISHVSGFTALGCIFRNSTGTNPQAGVDIEPNNGSVVCENIKFVACTFSGNNHFGFLVSFNFAQTAHQGNIDALGCTFTGNGVANDGGGGGIYFASATDVTVTGGASRSNTGPGVLLSGTTLPNSNIKIEGVTIESNTTYGVYGPQVANQLSILSCVVRNNGTAAAATYDGISVAPGAAASGIRIIGNQSTGASQRYGLAVSSNISGLTSIGNDFSGNGTGATSLGDDATTRIQLDGTSASIGTRVVWYSPSATSATLQSFRFVGDTADRLALVTDGRIIWGTGSAAGDVQLSRLATGVVGTGPAQTIRTGLNVTGSRPSATTVGQGSQFYDTTLHKPIWSDGTSWRDASGTVV